MTEFDKIIFCHKEHTDRLFGGLRIFDNSNKKVLSELTEELVDISIEQSPSKWIRAWRTVWGIYRNYTKRDYANIVSQIDNNKNVLVFISHSQYGTLVRRIKKEYPHVKVATYFHNIEMTMAYGRLKFYKKPLPLLEIVRDYRSEKLVAKYSDEIFLLNDRDKALFERYYSNRKVNICSVALPDKISGYTERHFGERLKLLFVGTFFWANIPGLIDFVNNVMPQVNADLYIVGKDMENIRKYVKFDIPNVYYIGRVTDEELDQYYKRCDILIAPITGGGGMKTKVAEALMYGLPIIGTYEAFCGYDICIEDVGFCSDNIIDYKEFIQRMDVDRVKTEVMSKKARMYYCKKYSLTKALDVYRSSLLQ